MNLLTFQLSIHILISNDIIVLHAMNTGIIFTHAGETVRFDFLVNNPNENPLDIYFLMDISASLSDDIAILRELSSNLS